MGEASRPDSVISLIGQLKAQGVPESEYERHVTRFLEWKARERKIPLRGNFELTPYCNLDCRMCYVHLDATARVKPRTLPAETWKDLIRQAHAAGMRRAALTGGECLTYEGFDAVYLQLYDLGIHPNILSNGILLDERRLDFFRRYPPHRVQISLYGSSDDAYERVTGHRCHGTVIRNALALRDAGIPLKIAITPNLYMRDDIDALLEQAESLGFAYYINANLIAPRENTGRGIADLPIGEYVRIYKKRNALKHVELEPPEEEELPEESHAGTASRGLRCGAGKSTFGIRHDGVMTPCLSLGGVEAYPLRDGFARAWADISRAAEAYPMPRECGTCVYSPVCIHCAAVHSSAGRPGHCNPRICERTKTMVAEGFIRLPDHHHDRREDHL